MGGKGARYLQQLRSIRLSWVSFPGPKAQFAALNERDELPRCEAFHIRRYLFVHSICSASGQLASLRQAKGAALLARFKWAWMWLFQLRSDPCHWTTIAASALHLP